MYGLGVVLVEVAFWRPIAELLGVHKGEKGARLRPRRIQDMLLQPVFLESVANELGDRFDEVVRRGLAGGPGIDISGGGDESKPEVGADIQRAFLGLVVAKLKRIDT